MALINYHYHEYMVMFRFSYNLEYLHLDDLDFLMREAHCLKATLFQNGRC